jgi:predicted transcriptional regulator
MVSNNLQWEAFNNYIDALIENQYRILEQADNDIIMYRSQGAVSSLRKLKLLRDEVLKNVS